MINRQFLAFLTAILCISLANASCGVREQQSSDEPTRGESLDILDDVANNTGDELPDDETNDVADDVTGDEENGTDVGVVVDSNPDVDGDGIPESGDCDDEDPNSPTLATDADCDGVPTTDDCDDNDPNVGVASTWWVDNDSDDHGSTINSRTACEQPDGYTEIPDDCDDSNPSIWSGCGSDLTETCTGPGPGLGIHANPNADSSGPEMHIVAVYEPHPGNTIYVDNNKPGEIILVLNSYEPVNWIVENTAGGTLSHIAMTGYNYNQSTLSGPATAGATITTTGYWSACSYEWPVDHGGCNTPGLVSSAEDYYSATMHSWRGCYGGDYFIIE